MSLDRSGAPRDPDGADALRGSFESMCGFAPCPLVVGSFDAAEKKNRLSLVEIQNLRLEILVTERLASKMDKIYRSIGSHRSNRAGGVFLDKTSRGFLDKTGHVG